MHWVLRLKRKANRGKIDAVLAATTARPTIVEVSTHDLSWGARPVAGRYEGNNLVRRLWMELRQQLREDDPAARSGAWARPDLHRLPRRRHRCFASRAAERLTGFPPSTPDLARRSPRTGKRGVALGAG